MKRVKFVLKVCWYLISNQFTYSPKYKTAWLWSVPSIVIHIDKNYTQEAEQ